MLNTAMYSAYVLSLKTQSDLLRVFPPRYNKVVAHHVTVEVSNKEPELPPEAELQVVGRVDSGNGLEALVVAVNGNTQRPDGNTYHITWSIDSDSGYIPRDSKMLLAKKRYKPTRPVPFKATPGVF